MKQTAVDWLVMKWATQVTLHSSDITKAIEMEKEQILNAYLESDKMEGRASLDDSEQYYKETYGQK
jgi:hypothetical protein